SPTCLTAVTKNPSNATPSGSAPTCRSWAGGCTSRRTSAGAPRHSGCSAVGLDPERRGDFLARVVGEVAVCGPGDRVLATDASRLGLADVTPRGPGKTGEITEVDRLDDDIAAGAEDRGEALRLVRGSDGPRPPRLRAIHRVRIAGVLAVDADVRRGAAKCRRLPAAAGQSQGEHRRGHRYVSGLHVAKLY